MANGVHCVEFYAKLTSSWLKTYMNRVKQSISSSLFLCKQSQTGNIWWFEFTSHINGDDAWSDDLGIAFHSLLGGGQRKNFRPVSLLVQGGGDVRDGKLRAVT